MSSINGSELNNCCEVSSICNSLHIELHLMCSICWLPFAMPCLFNLVMHHTWLCIMPWLCLCVYHVAWFFPVVLLLDSSVSLRLWGFVRLCWLVCFMDSIFFLAGFQARWPLSWISLLSLLASCLDAIAMSRYLPLVCQPPKLPWYSL